MNKTPDLNSDLPDALAPLVGVDPHQRLVTLPLRTLQRRSPVSLPSNTPIRDVAQAMRVQRVSSMLLVDDDRLVRIVTDRDLRNRVLAPGLSSDEPVSRVATPAPVTVQAGASAFEAMLLMARHNVHHVPVLDGTRVAGMVTATDLVAWHSNSAVALAGELHAQNSLDGLQQACARVPQMQRNLAASGASAYVIGQIVTAMTDALTVRLLQLAEAQLGPPPVPYAWVAAGSQARSEQTAKSDQDNCLVLDDRYDVDRDGPYFEALARQVCSGLDACGYVFCPGEMMAMTERWRQPLQRWLERFRHWIDQPEPAALMHTCVFFDMRLVHGESALLEALRTGVLQYTPGKGIFLAHMTRNALSRRPPLGLFGRLDTARSGAHRGTLDLKMQGIVPIIDLARVYSVAGGHPQVNTHDRLQVAAQGGEVSEQGARDLRHTLEFLASARIRHQVRRIEAGQVADNLLSPSTLSNFERTQLKNAFRVVQGLQDVLAQRYQSL